MRLIRPKTPYYINIMKMNEMNAVSSKTCGKLFLSIQCSCKLTFTRACKTLKVRVFLIDLFFKSKKKLRIIRRQCPELLAKMLYIRDVTGNQVKLLKC